MANLSDLVVRGSSRFLNTSYFNDINISGSATLASLSLSGNLSVTGTATFSSTISATGNITSSGNLYANGGYLYLSNKVAVDGGKTSANWLTLNGSNAFTSGTYIKNNFKTDTAIIENAGIDNLGVVDLNVVNKLRANQYDLQTVAQLGGSFYVSPTLKMVSSGRSLNVSRSNNVLTMQFNDASINATNMAGIVWTSGSSVKISGSIDTLVTGTMDGEIASINTSSHFIVITNITGGNADSIDIGDYTQYEFSDFSIMAYERNQGGATGTLVKTATGSVVSFSDGTDAAINDLRIGIEPVQDLHGQSNPYPAGGSSNKLPNALSGTTSSSGLTLKSNGDGTYVLTGSTSESSEQVYFDLVEEYTLQEGDYLHIGNSATNANVVLDLDKSDGVNIDYWSFSSTNRIAQISSAKAGQKVGRIRVYVSANISNINITLKPMICQSSTAIDFAPYSNICPITGWTEAKVVRCGKNLVPLDGWVQGQLSGDSGIPNGVSYSVSSPFILLKGGKTYLLSRNYPEYGSGQMAYHTYTLDKIHVSDSGWVTNNQTISPSNDCYIRLTTRAKPNTENPPDLSPSDVGTVFTVQLEIGSTATTYEPYAGQQYTIDLNGTRYGGTLDVTTGVLTVDRAMVDLSSLEYTKSASGLFMNTNAQWRNVVVDVDIARAISDIYVKMGSGAISGTNPDYYYKFAISKTNSNLYISDPRYATPSDYAEAMSGHMIVYELATPITVQLTPQEVTTLLGNNTIFADCGDSTVIYTSSSPDNNNYRVGIWMNCYDTANDSSTIRVYGGTSLTPNVMIGNLTNANLGVVNGMTPKGWGLFAQNAYLHGTVVAKSGSIGNFHLTETKMYSGSHDTYNAQNSGFFFDNNYISAGSGAPFYVDNSGNLYASSATIEGNITATSGTIGGCNIVNGRLTIGASQINGVYGTCDTQGSDSTKVVTCTNFELFSGAQITVSFINRNTYQSGAVKLNVNNTGEKDIYVGSSATYSTNKIMWADGASITFRYNGTGFDVVNEPRAWYGSCSTSASAQVKASAIDKIVICKGTVVNISMDNDNTNESPQLNISNASSGCSIYAGGSRSSGIRPTTANGYGWTSGSVATFVFDGIYWVVSDSSSINYITKIDNGGIKVHDAANTTDYIKITSSGTDIYKSGNCISSFGSSVVLGQITNGVTRVQIDNDSLDVISRNNNGVDTTVATFGEESIIGDMSARGLSITQDGLLMNNDGNQCYYIGTTSRNTRIRYYGGAEISDESPSTLNSIDNKYYYRVGQLPSDATVLKVASAQGPWDPDDEDILSAAVEVEIETWIRKDGYLWVYDEYYDEHTHFGDNISYEYIADGISTLPYYVFGNTPYNSINFSETPPGVMSLTQGNMCVAAGTYSFAGGNNSKASREMAFAYGNNCLAGASRSVAIGDNAFASSQYAVSIGASNIASGMFSLALGNGTNAEGLTSTALGDATYATGPYSISMGSQTTASGTSSTATGSFTTASGTNSFAAGLLSTASGSQSFASGYKAYATANNSSSFGENTTATHKAQFVIGTDNILDTTPSTNVHPLGTDYGNYAFIIGNGRTTTTRSNALTVDWNGNLSASGSISASGALATGNKPQTRKNIGVICGSVNDCSVQAGKYADYPVSFGSYSFSSTPYVVVGFVTNSDAGAFGKCCCTALLSSISTTGFTIRVFNGDTSGRSPRCHWIAIGN